MYDLGEIVLNEEDPLLGGSKITMKRKHERVRYPCDKCEYSATKQSHLTKHINHYFSFSYIKFHTPLLRPLQKVINSIL